MNCTSNLHIIFHPLVEKKIMPIKPDIYLCGTSFRKRIDDNFDSLGWAFCVEECRDGIDPHSYDEDNINRMRHSALISCRINADEQYFNLSNFDYFDCEKLKYSSNTIAFDITEELKKLIAQLVNPPFYSGTLRILRNESKGNWVLGYDGFSILANDIDVHESDLLFESVGLFIAERLNEL